MFEVSKQTRATICMGSPKFDNRIMRKCRLVWWVWISVLLQILVSEFGINNMRAWLHPALDQIGSDGMLAIFTWQILDPLVPTEHCLNATAHLNVAADHVHPFMITVCLSSESWNHLKVFLRVTGSPELNPAGHLWHVIEQEICFMDVQPIKLQHMCDGINHVDQKFRQFWRQTGVQAGIWWSGHWVYVSYCSTTAVFSAFFQVFGGFFVGKRAHSPALCVWVVWCWAGSVEWIFRTWLLQPAVTENYESTQRLKWLAIPFFRLIMHRNVWLRFD